VKVMELFCKRWH